MRLFTLILLMISTAVLSGCAGYKPAGNAVHHELVAPYRVDSGDRLRVIVFGQNDLTNTYMVDKAGAISMPLIGGVPVRGRTTAEIDEGRGLPSADTGRGRSSPMPIASTMTNRPTI